MNIYLDVLKKYAVFTGRATRKEYWTFFIINLVIVIVLGMIHDVLVIIYGLATFLPGLGLAFRRLHDTNRTAWWLLIALIPFLGGIVLLIFTLQDSDAADNQYGPNPKAGAIPQTVQV